MATQNDSSGWLMLIAVGAGLWLLGRVAAAPANSSFPVGTGQSAEDPPAQPATQTAEIKDGVVHFPLPPVRADGPFLEDTTPQQYPGGQPLQLAIKQDPRFLGPPIRDNGGGIKDEPADGWTTFGNYTG